MVHLQVAANALGSEWSSAPGVNNQEHWIAHAEQNGGRAAFFIIHAVDEKAGPRKVSSIDDYAVFIGDIVREGTKTFIRGRKTSL